MTKELNIIWQLIKKDPYRIRLMSNEDRMFIFNNFQEEFAEMFTKNHNIIELFPATEKRYILGCFKEITMKNAINSLKHK